MIDSPITSLCATERSDALATTALTLGIQIPQHQGRIDSTPHLGRVVDATLQSSRSLLLWPAFSSAAAMSSGEIMLVWMTDAFRLTISTSAWITQGKSCNSNMTAEASSGVPSCAISKIDSGMAYLDCAFRTSVKMHDLKWEWLRWLLPQVEKAPLACLKSSSRPA